MNKKNQICSDLLETDATYKVLLLHVNDHLEDVVLEFCLFISLDFKIIFLKIIF